MTRVRKEPGRKIQSLSESSFDAWTKLYRRNEDSPNTQISYYSKGALLALALDLHLRQHSAINLDTIMHTLWKNHGLPHIGLDEGEFEQLVSQLSGLDLDQFFHRYVRGVDDIELDDLLCSVGVQLKRRAAISRDDVGGKPAKRALPDGAGVLGARFAKANGGVRLSTVLHGGAASQAGMSSGDVIVAVDGLKADIGEIYQQIAEVGAGQCVQIHAFRQDVLMVFMVTLTEPEHNVYWLELIENASPAQLQARKNWLNRE